jgi:hypothetical protein
VAARGCTARMVEATPPGLKRDCNAFKAAAFKRILRQERLPTCMRAQASTRLARLHPLLAKLSSADEATRMEHKERNRSTSLRIRDGLTVMLVVGFGEQGVSIIIPHCL